MAFSGTPDSNIFLGRPSRGSNHIALGKAGGWTPCESLALQYGCSFCTAIQPSQIHKTPKGQILGGLGHAYLENIGQY